MRVLLYILMALVAAPLAFGWVVGPEPGAAPYVMDGDEEPVEKGAREDALHASRQRASQAAVAAARKPKVRPPPRLARMRVVLPFVISLRPPLLIC